MSHVLIHLQGHMTLPLWISVKRDTMLPDRYYVSVKIDQVLIGDSEVLRTEEEARARASFLMEVWEDRLKPAFEAGYAAGLDEFACGATRRAA